MVAELEEIEKKRKCTESEKHGVFTNDFATFFVLLCALKSVLEKYDQNINKKLYNPGKGYLHLKKTISMLSDLLLV